MRCFFIYLSRGTARVYTHLQTAITRFQTPTSQCLDNELDLVLRVITYNFDTLVATIPLKQTLKWKDFWGLEMTCQHLECSFSVRFSITASPYSLHIPHPASSWNEVTPVGFPAEESVLRNPPSRSSLMSGKQKTEGWPRFIEQASGLKKNMRQWILRSHIQKGRWDLAFVRRRNYTEASFVCGLDVHYDWTFWSISVSPNEITVR